MCETSKMPTADRTARASARMDVYWRGISHPPKGTIRPPAAWCSALSGVRSRGGVGEATALPSWLGCSGW